MAAFRLLRFQSYNFNHKTLHLHFSPANSIIFRNQVLQNPQYSRHFLNPTTSHFFNSFTHKYSAESSLLAFNPQNEDNPSNFPIPEPVIEQNPSWTVYNSTFINPKSNNEQKTNGNLVNSVQNSSTNAFTRDFIGKRKKGKSKVNWVCSKCGHSEAKWWGSCNACKAFGTMDPFTVSENEDRGKVSGFEVSETAVRSWLPQQRTGQSAPVRLIDVNRGFDDSAWRIQLSGIFGGEVARVLGGGLVPGSLVLLGGDPGVGKSTLLLQIAALIAESCDPQAGAPVVYISGEESVEQIGNRADRLRIEAENLFLYSSTDVEDILSKVQLLNPCAVVIDSVQTVYLKGVPGSPGGMAQVRECTAALLRFAKQTNIPVLLIGHVTKSGDIAGPQYLEHIVDVVLYMEGEKHSLHRLLRSVKNRFGSTDELGVFEMSESGLKAVSNPSEMFMSQEHSNSELLAGLAVAVILDGSRTFLIEVQALCVTESVGRTCNGIQGSRADMIISVLKKQAGMKMQDCNVYLNVVSGVSLTETAGDLAVAAAICSSYLEVPIPNHVAFIGEIGLGGELRMVTRIDKRVNTVAKLGYKTCIVPKSAEKSLPASSFEGLKIVGCKNLKQVINEVFKI
ncbi:unnamed protein product [Amaranthus hypochondriacus]